MKSIASKFLYSLNGVFKTIGNKIGHLYEIALQRAHITGTNITINDSAAGPMSMTLNPNTSQETTKGNQLFDISKITNASADVANGSLISTLSNGYEVKGNEDSSYGEYHYNLGWLRPGINAANQNARVTLNAASTIYISADVTLKSLYNNFNHIKLYLYGDNNYTNATIQELTLNQKVRVTQSYNVEPGTYYPIFTLSGNDLTIENIMISTSGDTDYEPYTGGIASPNSSYPQDMHVVTGDNTLKVGNKNFLPQNNGETRAGVEISNVGTTFMINGTSTNAANIAYSDYIHLPAGRYRLTERYISGTIDATIMMIFRKKGSTINLAGRTFSLDIYKNDWGYSFTLEEDTDIIYNFYVGSADRTYNNFKFDIQLTKGNTNDFDFVEHKEQTVQLNLGDLEYCEIPNSNYKDEFVIPSKKNKININGNIVKREVATYSNIKVSGDTLSYNTTGATAGYLGFIVPVTIGQIYTLSWRALTGDIRYVELDEIITSINTEYGNHTSSGSTITPSKPYLGIWLQIGGNSSASVSKLQLEEGSAVTEYEPYSDGKWYLKKNTRHLLLKIADMNNAENYPGWKYQNQLFNDFSEYNGPLKNLTKYSCNIVLEKDNYFYLNTRVTDNILFIAREVINLTQTEWKTNYPDLEVELYYGLKTPEYILLNDTLQEQLTKIYNMLLSYKVQTNITQVNNDLPFKLDIEYIKKLD